MDILFLHLLVISLPVKGMLWFLLICLLCLFGVHITQLAKLGWQYKKRKSVKTTQPAPEPKKEDKKAPIEKQPEPIYYIVEKKTRRAKATYGEPKPIDFHKEK